jgi:hypothetical protein
MQAGLGYRVPTGFRQASSRACLVECGRLWGWREERQRAGGVSLGPNLAGTRENAKEAESLAVNQYSLANKICTWLLVWTFSMLHCCITCRDRELKIKLTSIRKEAD